MYRSKDIAKLTWPMLVELGMGALLGITGTMMISIVGEAAVSGVGLVDTLNFFIMQFYTAIATGATVVVSQLTGRRDPEGVKKTIVQASMLAVGVALLIMVLILIWAKELLVVLYGQVNGDVFANALVYLTVSTVTYPFLALYSTLAGALRGRGDSRSPMAVSLVMNVVNIASGLFFIFVCGFGIYGVSAALLLARVVGAGLIFFLLIRKDGNLFGAAGVWRFDWKVLKAVLVIGIPAGLDALIFQAGKILSQTFITDLGTAVLAANAIGGSLFNLICLPGNALSMSVVTMAGQSWGQGMIDECRKVMRKTVLLAMGTLALLAVILFLPMPFIISLYKPGAESAAIVWKLMLLMFATMAPIWPASFVLPNGLRATGDVGYVTAVSIASMWLVRVLLGYVFCRTLGMGLFGIWLAMSCDWVARAVFYLARYRSGRWSRRFRADEKPAEAEKKEESLTSAGV